MDFLRQLSGIQNATTHLITAENVYGKKGAGAMAEYSTIPQEDVVKIGQLIAEADGMISANIHASVNGTVTEVFASKIVIAVQG